MDVRRVRPEENVNAVAAGQVKALLSRLPAREITPLFVFDAGYDPVGLQQGLKGRPAQILVRLRGGRCFYADPVGAPAKTGRPRRHGRKMDTKDSDTWPEPSAEHTCEDAGYGTVRVRAWARTCTRRSRPMPSAAAVAPLRSCAGRWFWWRWSGCPAARGGASRESCGCGGTARANRTWIFCGAPMRGALIWSIPSAFSSRVWDGAPLACATPEQADRWTWIVLAAFTQLRLARPCAADRRLPRERRYEPGYLTPVRVRRSILALLPELGTPAKPPKPCGRSPGRPKGRRSGRAKRYPALKKTA